MSFYYSDSLKILLLLILLLLCLYSAVLKGLNINNNNNYLEINESKVFLSTNQLVKLLCASTTNTDTCNNIINKNYNTIKNKNCKGYINQYELCVYKNTNCNILIVNVNACMYMSSKQLLL